MSQQEVAEANLERDARAAGAVARAASAVARAAGAVGGDGNIKDGEGAGPGDAGDAGDADAGDADAGSEDDEDENGLGAANEDGNAGEASGCQESRRLRQESRSRG